MKKSKINKNFNTIIIIISLFAALAFSLTSDSFFSYFIIYFFILVFLGFLNKSFIESFLNFKNNIDIKELKFLEKIKEKTIFSIIIIFNTMIITVITLFTLIASYYMFFKKTGTFEMVIFIGGLSIISFIYLLKKLNNYDSKKIQDDNKVKTLYIKSIIPSITIFLYFLIIFINQYDDRNSTEIDIKNHNENRVLFEKNNKKNSINNNNSIIYVTKDNYIGANSKENLNLLNEFLLIKNRKQIDKMFSDGKLVLLKKGESIIFLDNNIFEFGILKIRTDTFPNGIWVVREAIEEKK